MATYDDLLPGDEEQLLVCGQKGAGKTTLIKKLLTYLPGALVIIIDSKPDWEDLEPMLSKTDKPRKLDMRLLWTLNGLDAKGVYVYQTAPDRPAYADANVDKLIYWALKRYDKLKKSHKKHKKNLTFVIDEMGDFAKGSYTTPAMSRLLRQGRSKKVRTIVGSQRPSGIPTLAIDQSQRFCIFMLMNKNDRKRLADWVHPGLMTMASGRNFWYYEIPRDREEKPLTLMRQEKTHARK